MYGHTSINGVSITTCVESERVARDLTKCRATFAPRSPFGEWCVVSRSELFLLASLAALRCNTSVAKHVLVHADCLVGERRKAAVRFPARGRERLRAGWRKQRTSCGPFCFFAHTALPPLAPTPKHASSHCPVAFSSVALARRAVSARNTNRNRITGEGRGLRNALV